MLKRLRDHLKNKKGFTMAELIIVIVIILVLSAALVPQLLKYVEQANQANCKSDAATMLAQLQADYVSHEATATGTFTPRAMGGITPEEDTNLSAAITGTTAAAKFKVDDHEIVAFSYNNGKYTTYWDGNEWTDPVRTSN